MFSPLKKIIIIGFVLTFTIFPCLQSLAVPDSFSVTGDVKTTLTISLDDLKKMDAFHINNVTLLKERTADEPEERISVHNYKGVLLRDILEKAGMKYVRKWEPGVYVRVTGKEGREVIFSFGEIFYSSIGRSILIAYEKDGRTLPNKDGIGHLIVSTDLRSGRCISGISEIKVERVNINMQVYEDMKENVTRPPTSSFLLIDYKTQKSMQIGLADLKQPDSMFIPNVVLTGECAGFHGVYSFKGVSLRSLLEKLGIDPYSGAYDRFVAISSENGFSATFSFGELFNSRLSDNIIIAYEKDGKPLNDEDAVAMSAAREDSTGGRSVRRISKIEFR